MNYFGRFSRTLCIGAIVALATNLAVAAPQSGRAKVVQVVGKANIGSAAAASGTEIGAGSVVTTGPGSEVSLNLGAAGLLNLHEVTTFSIDELSSNVSGPEALVSAKSTLKSGKVDAKVGHLSSSSKYSVQTAVNTIKTLGATFTAYSTGAVLVWDGCVDVVTKDAKYSVCAGQMYDPSSNAVTSIPSGLGAPRFAGGVGSAPPAAIGNQVFVSPVGGK